MAARNDAPECIVLVGEAAEGCAASRAPRYVRHAVHDVIRVLYHKSAGVCYGGEASLRKQPCGICGGKAQGLGLAAVGGDGGKRQLRGDDAALAAELRGHDAGGR